MKEDLNMSRDKADIDIRWTRQVDAIGGSSAVAEAVSWFVKNKAVVNQASMRMHQALPWL
jgi:hypothetical protein